jgi:hypothetical protein
MVVLASTKQVALCRSDTGLCGSLCARSATGLFYHGSAAFAAPAAVMPAAKVMAAVVLVLEAAPAV